MRKGFIVVSGCPRSGTSLQMEIHREVHGDDAICGYQFPQEHRPEIMDENLKKKENESFFTWQTRKYIIEKNLAQSKPINETFKDMNPDGFWEMAFTVSGIKYQYQFKPLFDEILSGKNKIVKVVSQGLLNSDPRYISKIIYMIRHPRAVAKSQERLKRGFDIKHPDGSIKNIFEDLKIHTPEMYISVTCDAAKFFIENKDIPVYFINFEDLISNPDILDNLQTFIGFGDYKKGKSIIKPSLNRSKAEDIENKMWEDAEFIYNEFNKAVKIINSYIGDDQEKTTENREKATLFFQSILDYISEPKREFNKSQKQWPCYRAKKHVDHYFCKRCQENEEVMQNLKKHSESIISKNSVTKHWAYEPCLFECGMDVERENYLTIEESIENNFWNDIK